MSENPSGWQQRIAAIAKKHAYAVMEDLPEHATDAAYAEMETHFVAALNEAGPHATDARPPAVGLSDEAAQALLVEMTRMFMTEPPNASNDPVAYRNGWMAAIHTISKKLVALPPAPEASPAKPELSASQRQLHATSAIVARVKELNYAADRHRVLVVTPCELDRIVLEVLKADASPVKETPGDRGHRGLDDALNRGDGSYRP